MSIKETNPQETFDNAKGILVSNTYFIDNKVVKSAKLFEKNVQELVLELKNPKNKLFYDEVFYSSKHKTLRLYFDIEWYSEEEDLTKDYLNYILRALDREKITYVVASASSYRDEKEKFKNSFRIISTNTVFNSMIEMKAYIMFHLRMRVMEEYSLTHDIEECDAFQKLMFETKHNKILDTAVYCNGQRKVRLPNTYKMNKEGKPDPQTYMRIVSGNIKDFFITDPIDNPSRIHPVLLEVCMDVMNKSVDKVVIEKYNEKDAAGIDRKIKRMKYLLELFPENIAYKTDTWFKVMSAISGIAVKSGRDLLDTAIKFSKRAKNYDEAGTISKYKYFTSSKFVGRHCGLKTLVNIAKECGVLPDEIGLDDMKEFKCEYDDLTTYLNTINGEKVSKNDVLLNLGNLLYMNALNGMCVVYENGKKLYKPLIGPISMCRHYKFYDKSAPPKTVKVKGSKDTIEVDSEVNVANLINDNIQLFNLKGILFDPRIPSGLSDGIYNTWNGFKAKKVDNLTSLSNEELEKKVERILYHIREVWCSGCEASYKFLINWLASIIQKPWNKTGVCVILKSSTHGTGKGLMTNFLRDFVFGRELSGETGDLDRLMGRFNSGYENKLLTILDEASNVSGSEAFNKYADMLKNKITSEVQTIEIKGKEPREVSDYNNYIISTNNAMPIRLEESDRRYFWLEVSTKHVGQKEEYYIPLRDEVLLKQEFGDLFYTWLLRRPVKDSMDIPNTRFRMQAKINGLKPIQRWLLDLNIKDEVILMKTFYDMYKEWTKDNNMKTENVIWFGRSLPEMHFKRVRSNAGQKINFSKQEVLNYMKSIGVEIE